MGKLETSLLAAGFLIRKIPYVPDIRFLNFVFSNRFRNILISRLLKTVYNDIDLYRQEKGVEVIGDAKILGICF